MSEELDRFEQRLLAYLRFRDPVGPYLETPTKTIVQKYRDVTGGATTVRRALLKLEHLGYIRQTTRNTYPRWGSEPVRERVIIVLDMG